MVFYFSNTNFLLFVSLLDQERRILFFLFSLSFWFVLLDSFTLILSEYVYIF